MTRFLIFILYFLSSCVVAQKIDISGIVKDSKTGEIVPFATIELLKRQVGVAANFHGKFQIQLPNDCFNDTLKVCSLGYKTSQIIIGTLRIDFSNVVILLTPIVYTLNEVEIVGVSAGKYRLGNYEDTKKGYGGWLTGLKSQIAVFMDCKKYKNAKIVNASFFIAKKTGKPETPFRVRVYNVDLKSGNPGDDLIHDNVIVHGNRKGGWLIVDLSKYNLKAPSTGYFIAMEWIDSGEQYYYQTYINPLGKYVTNYGQSISQSRTIKIPNTWLKFLGRDWIIESGREYHNSLIISEIEVLK